MLSCVSVRGVLVRLIILYSDEHVMAFIMINIVYYSLKANFVAVNVDLK